MSRSIWFLVFGLFCGCTASLEKLPYLYERVSSDYEKLLKKNPQDLDLRIKLAKFHYQFNDYEKVKELLEGLKEKEARVILAKTLVHTKDYTWALEIFEQIGQIDDDEYLYLYALTCEEKNLFPKAIDIYRKLTPPFKKLARASIKRIGIRIEEGLPQNIKELIKDEESFLSTIDKEEAVILLVDEAIRIKENNTSVSSFKVIQKVLKEKGKDLAEAQISYDSTYERVELEYARTITARGEIIYAGKNNIRDVSKYLNFPLYSNARALIISMPSVEIGSIIEYKAKIYSSSLINKDDFTFIYRLRERYPIGRANFKLIVPKNKEVRFKYLNRDYAQGINLACRYRESKKERIYSWEFKGLKPIIPEDEMPQPSLVNPAIIISSFTSWQEIYLWWYNLFKNKISLDKEVKEFVRDLVKDSSSDLEKAKKIYEFCAKNIRYVAVEYGESGYEPHEANEVFWNRYGDCKDQVTLLVAMLREAGLAAYPVLIPTRSSYSLDENFPSVNFNHAIAACSYNGGLVFMDPTASTTSFFDLPLDDQERKVLVFFDDGYKILTTPLIRDNGIIYEMKIDIDGNEDARIERRVTTKGYFAAFQRYYLKYTHPEEIKEDIQKKAVQISPFSQLIDYKIENVDDFDKSPVLEYTFQTKKFLNPAKDLRVIAPLSDLDISFAYVSKDERNFPIEFAAIVKKISQIEIKLPSNLGIKYLPQKIKLNTKWFDFESNYAHQGNLLRLYQEFAIKRRFVKLDEYKEFKKNLEEVFYFLRGEIILEKLRNP